MYDLTYLTEPGAQPAQPSLARIADWLLGGTQNWAVDRAAGAQLETMNPDVRNLMLESRLFEQRAVEYAVGSGVHQFVDIGSGLPTMGCVHEVADQVRPQHDVRVVYVDIDPAVHAHSALLIKEHGDPDRQHALTGDLLDSAILWQRLLDDGLIDARQPLCVLVTALLHFIKDEQRPAQHLAYYRQQLVPGSLLVLSQSTDEGVEDSKLYEQAVEYHQKSDPGQLRSRAELTAFFGDFVLVEPGVTFAPLWRPSPRQRSPFTDHPSGSQLLAGVGRKG